MDHGYFWCLAVVHGAIGVFALYRMTARPAVPLDDQVPYVPMASQMVTITSLAAATLALDFLCLRAANLEPVTTKE